MTQATAISVYLAKLKDSPVSLEDFDRITISPTPARPRSTGIPWAAVAVGAVLGGAIVAIAGWVL